MHRTSDEATTAAWLHAFSCADCKTQLQLPMQYPELTAVARSEPKMSYTQCHHITYYITYTILLTTGKCSSVADITDNFIHATQNRQQP